MSRLSDAPEAGEDSSKEIMPKGQTDFGRMFLGRSVKNAATVIEYDGALSLDHIIFLFVISGTGTFVGPFYVVAGAGSVMSSIPGFRIFT